MYLKKKQSEVFLDKSKNRLIVCGRRGGKTYFATWEILSKLVNNKNYSITYTAPTHNQAKEIFWETFLNVCPQEYILKKHETTLDLTLLNGSKLKVRSSSNYDRLRGGTNNEIYLDEVQDTPMKAYSEALRPTIATTEGYVTLLGTPKGHNWVNDLVNNPNWSFHSWTTAEGGLVSLEEIERAKQELDERTFRQEYLAEFLSSEGAIFYSFSDDNIVDVDFDKDKTLYLSFDFNVNPMTCVMFQDNVAVKEFEVPHSNTADISNKIIRFLEEKQFNSTIYITGDNTGNNRNTSATKTNYIIIGEIFKKYLPEQSPIKTRHVINIEDRFNTTNTALKSYSGDIKLRVSKNCKKLIKYLNIITREDFVRDKLGITHLTDAFTYYPYNFIPIKPMKEAYI